MEVQQRNIWKYYDGWKIHSDSKRKLNKICKVTGGYFCCEYYKKSKRVFAWDIFVPAKYISKARKILKE